MICYRSISGVIYYAVFSFHRLLFQPHVFGSIRSFPNLQNMSLLLHIIVTYIKENDYKITKIIQPTQKPQGKKLLCTGDLSPARKIFIERPAERSFQSKYEIMQISSFNIKFSRATFQTLTSIKMCISAFQIWRYFGNHLAKLVR